MTTSYLSPKSPLWALRVIFKDEKIFIRSVSKEAARAIFRAYIGGPTNGIIGEEVPSDGLPESGPWAVAVSEIRWMDFMPMEVLEQQMQQQQQTRFPAGKVGPGTSGVSW